MKKWTSFILIGLLLFAGTRLLGQSEVNITPGIMKPELISYLNDPRRPRGIRNNNPGNIRRGTSNWLGKVAWSESKDKNFEQFQFYFYGVRALIVIINNYFTKYNLNTISKIIDRWAPPTENDTDSYIKAVSSLTGFKKSQILSNDKETLRKLTYAIADHENGIQNPISDEVFDYAYSKI